MTHFIATGRLPKSTVGGDLAYGQTKDGIVIQQDLGEGLETIFIGFDQIEVLRNILSHVKDLRNRNDL